MAIQNVLFIEFESLCQKLWAFLSNFGFFTMSAHQIGSCHVTQDTKFYFVPILHLILGKVTKFIVEKLSTSEISSKKPHGGVKQSVVMFAIQFWYQTLLLE